MSRNLPYNNTVLALAKLIELNEALRKEVTFEDNQDDYVKQYGTVFCSAGHRTGNTTAIGEYIAMCPIKNAYFGYWSWDKSYSEQVVKHLQENYSSSIEVVSLEDYHTKNCRIMFLDCPRADELKKWQEVLNPRTMLVVVGGIL